MGRYAGLIALLVLAVAAAIYTFGTGAPVKSPAPPIPTVSTIPQTPSQPRRSDTVADSSPAPPAAQTDVPLGSGFDFYVLSLSWSPTFCQTAAPGSNASQCGPSRRFGLIVHGLWPQNENGFPQDCATSEPDRVPDTIARSVLDIMPSLGLIGHEWRKHGSCSGLRQAEYFSVLRQAYQRVKIPQKLADARAPQVLAPPDIERLFSTANPSLDAQGLSVACEDGRLEEVRICLTKQLEFRNCRQVDRQSCRARSLTIPPMR